MQRLLQAEALTAGIPPGVGGLSFPTDNQGDGGVDALVDVEPATPTRFLSRRTVFQAKKTLNLAALSRQLRKQAYAKKLLRGGAAYCLVVAQPVKPADARRLSATLEKVLGKWVPSELYGLEQLGAWLGQYRQLITSVPGLSQAGHHLIRFEDWESRFQPLMPWTADSARTNAVQRVAQLRQGSVLRISGAPGVGKTRLVLESLRSRAAIVAYVSEYVPEIMGLVASDSPVRGVLVVDECSRTEHERLKKLLASGVTLITIGCEEELSTLPAADELRLGPLEQRAMQQLATSLPALDLSSRLELAPRSGGYPKYLSLLAEAVAAAPEQLLSRTPLRRRELVQLTDRLLGSGGHLAAIRALAVPTSVDVGPAPTDLHVLSGALGVPEESLRRAYEDLHQRGLIGRINDRAYVTPQILAESLALGFWGAFPVERFAALQRAGLDEHLAERCFSRLEQGGAESKAVLATLGKSPEVLSGAVGRGAVHRMVGHLADSSGATAIEIARQLLASEGWSFELGIAIARAAWSAASFHAAVELLTSQLCTRPVDQDTDLLPDLFASLGPLTSAPAASRLEALNHLARRPEAAARSLSVRCAAMCLSNELTFRAGFEERTRPWPSSRDEDLAYRLAAVGVLSQLMGDGDEVVRRGATEAASRQIRTQAFDGYPQVSLALVTALADRQQDLDIARSEVAMIREFDLERMGTSGVEVLAKLEELIAPRTLRDRLSMLLTKDLDLAPEAHASAVDGFCTELLASQEPNPALALLFSPGAGRFVIGVRAGQLDTARRLLERIEILAGEPDAFPLFSSGYLSAIVGSPTLGEVLDGWAAKAGLASAAFDATVRLGLDEAGARRASRLIAEGRIPPERLAEAFGSYARASSATRGIFRPLLQDYPLIWLRLAFFRVHVEKESAASLGELRAAWSASLSSAESREGEWLRATRLLLKRDPAWLREQVVAFMKRERAFPVSLVKEARMIVTPWRPFAQALDSFGQAELAQFSYSVRGQLEAITADEVLEWVKGEPSRLAIAARIVGPVHSSSENAAAALLDAYPSNALLHRALTFPEVVFDSTTVALNRHLQRLRGFIASGRPGLASWARALLPQFEAHLEHNELEDAEEQAGLGAWHERGRKVSHALYKLAEAQAGYFSADQAKKTGCSAQLLNRYQKTGKAVRVRRSIYRLVEFPASEHEELVVLWLWSERRGVFSHATALSLHKLSNVLPQRVELTVPARWKARRIKTMPEGLLLHFANLSKEERVAVGPVWMTSVQRTLADCAEAQLDLSLLREAREEARARGLIP